MKIIKFSATWCVPCKSYKKIWDNVKTKYPDVEWIEYDVEENDIQTEEFNIRSVPTTIFIGPKGTKTNVGTLTESQIEEIINESTL